MKKRYNFISRLINKITLNSQSNNDSFSYYGHWVELQSGTVDYMSVTIYNTSDRYSGTLVECKHSINSPFHSKNVILLL